MRNRIPVSDKDLEILTAATCVLRDLAARHNDIALIYDIDRKVSRVEFGQHYASSTFEIDCHWEKVEIDDISP